MPRRPRALVALFVPVLFALALAPAAAAGPLDPPAGPIASTAKPLGEIEPRTPIGPATTPGDASSVYRITQSGSYYLTGNVAGASGKHGIEVAASNVTIDLNGFTLAGVAGSLSGIDNDSTAIHGLSVHNGSIIGWGGDGINFGPGGEGSRFERLRIATCGGTGIQAGANAVITACTVQQCGQDGIVCNVRAVITGCVIERCGQNGIAALDGTVVDGCSITQCGASGVGLGFAGVVRATTSNENVAFGFETGTGATITNCSASGNGASGFRLLSQSILTASVAASNFNHGVLTQSSCSVTDCVATGNLANGIQVQSNCVVRGNVCADNGLGASEGAGIFVVGADCRVEGNTCRGADRGVQVSAAGNIIVRNTCSGNTTNWDIAAGNVCLVVNAATAGVILGNAGGTAPGSTDPSANFTY